VSDDPQKRDDEKARCEALFRYRVLSPLLDEDAELSLRKRVEERAAQPHRHPCGELRTFSQRTLWTWLGQFRQGGIEALHPCHRKDKGKLRALTPEVLLRAELLRRELPSRWTSTVLDILIREQTLTKEQAPHRATLDRQLLLRGASRRQLQVLGEKRTCKLHFAAFFDLWVGDYHHGPKVLCPDGRIAVAKLGAFIDHTTRYPVADRWYLGEDISTLRDTLLRALLRFGIPKVVYTDRGAVYRAEQLAYSLAALGSHLVHSRPYYSQGRGVIERWWQLADAFQAEIEAREELLSIHELNRLWESFRTFRYLEAVHSDLGITPTQAIANVVPKPLDPAVARELFLVRADRRVHPKDGCISVEGHRFLCDASLRGRKITVRYDPLDLSSVLLFVDGVRLGRALPQPVGRLSDPPPPSPPPTGPKTDYLALLRADYDRRLIEQARPLAYADLGKLDPGFDLSRFATLLADLTQASVRDSQAQEVNAFWASFGPLPEKLVRIALDQAVRLRGSGRHVRVYLAMLRTFVLTRMQTPNPTEDLIP
jgi:transposase InsO family protein